MKASRTYVYIFKVSSPQYCHVWLQTVTLCRGIIIHRKLGLELWIFLHLMFCKLMPAPLFLSLFIHWKQMFFFACRGFPLQRRYSNPGVTLQKKRHKESLSHVRTPYILHTNTRLKTLSWRRGIRIVSKPFFQLCWVFHARLKAYAFFPQICIKFYADYHQRNTLTVDP